MKMMFLLLVYRCHFNSSWPVAEGCTLYTKCPLCLKTSTDFIRLHPWYVFLILESRKDPDCKTVRTNLFSTPGLSLLSPTSYSVLLPCQLGNIGLHVHRNRCGLLRTGKLGGREFLYLTLTRYTVTTRMTLH